MRCDAMQRNASKASPSLTVNSSSRATVAHSPL
jgi:hypothetical protein